MHGGDSDAERGRMLCRLHDEQASKKDPTGQSELVYARKERAYSREEISL